MWLDENIYNAFAVPDFLLSVFLYVGAVGLLRGRRYGLMAAFLAMGMWLFDSLLVLGISKLERINIIGPFLFFACFIIFYLWKKQAVFN